MQESNNGYDRITVAVLNMHTFTVCVLYCIHYCQYPCFYYSLERPCILRSCFHFNMVPGTMNTFKNFLILFFYVLLTLTVVTSSPASSIPEHRGSASIALIQGYIDYMSAHIVFVQATQLMIEVTDRWEGIQPDTRSSQQDATLIQICGSCKWNSLQITVHRSTTKGLFGIVQRLYEFIMQQKKRSERTIGLMIPSGTAASSAFAAYQEEQKRTEESRAKEIGERKLYAMCM